jgi:hypothetical protein
MQKSYQKFGDEIFFTYVMYKRLIINDFLHLPYLFER